MLVVTYVLCHCGQCNSVPESVGHHHYTFIDAVLSLQVMLSVCS
jgi:hypothetical protein